MTDDKPIEPLPVGRDAEFLEVAAWLREQIARAFSGRAPIDAPAVVVGEPWAPREVTFGRLQIEVSRAWPEAPRPDHVPTGNPAPSETTE